MLEAATIGQQYGLVVLSVDCGLRHVPPTSPAFPYALNNLSGRLPRPPFFGRSAPYSCSLCLDEHPPADTPSCYRGHHEAELCRSTRRACGPLRRRESQPTNGTHQAEQPMLLGAHRGAVTCVACRVFEGDCN